MPSAYNDLVAHAHRLDGQTFEANDLDVVRHADAVYGACSYIDELDIILDEVVHAAVRAAVT